MTRADGPRVPSPAGPAWSRWLGRLLAHGVWATQVTGAHHVPRTGPVLLAANHTGLVDGPLLAGVAPRPTHILVKEEMFTGPVGLVLRAAGQIPVDRDGGRTALTVALGVLRRGGVVGIFPEGNRGRGDAASARAGIAWLALNGHAPVVPVALLGTRRTGESVGHVPGLRRPLVAEFGPPVVVERAPGTSGRAALVDANEAVRAALSDVVARAVARTGLVLPTDDPNRERA
ncbi:lysophospholipid acyltransferase family protein [Cellulomonas fimi]|uniref:Phospholipid/glycerol acyltransferase n=1 Tax=Cellulomonas fimi (strain ATCC 484 / DSM 20113 / JCM 1341 / CCUG 24087 / LMG 16345 / NBRC 15513 / NCIMB 8980 / NCTC 7547 / NRS-133) TaxID=590998 RepID=F4GZ23_CELFA|nr:lysophospholipid acyltransferase family protein [Cellulomonas fimi]AEE46013.1 phospholipid/glycerol acyltransferase [Cellulomonas fimi ATCC 484]NNH08913.1 1-acyl-sn-glycerol-3-phosphate acyltransferase [Cellulomonas fimi]VEH31290.1 2-acyl-glycerophospho-ethanolamine acyltransferase [Cellulomonas fimi]